MKRTDVEAERTDATIRLKGPGFLEMYGAGPSGAVLELNREQAERARALLDEWLGSVTRKVEQP